MSAPESEPTTAPRRSPAGRPAGTGARRATGARSAAAETGQLQSVHRALDLIEALAAQNGNGTLAALADGLGLARSTAHRLLATLTARGYINQDPLTGRYRIGVRAFDVGCTFLDQNQLRDVARPVMRQLVTQVNETVNLAVLDGDEAMYVDMADSTQTVRTFARIGARVPLHCTGVGKALMTGMSPQEVRRVARQQGLRRYTPTTCTRAEDLLAEVTRAAELGYVLDREEYDLGVRCAAAPVRDHTGKVVAAMSTSGPAYRISDTQLLALASRTRAAAEELSRALGYRPPAEQRRARRSARAEG